MNGSSGDNDPDAPSPYCSHPTSAHLFHPLSLALHPLVGVYLHGYSSNYNMYMSLKWLPI